ncbi:hypothetical protein FC19_GL002034 [Liquorilactobacillus aquaticus DSM 21051]|uniref:Uncharacterized protein n=1 Tax=Liquorilactobacillus aquaticus DSM 21051 TaxID=1423725 RepID=A0A0R2CUG9_9LACO|nr:hypothetical protein [Liquorilactobacillus aquaticus]KRM95416.1 hypothetical protein FC19_GL002034 [Liquorilactobacillus aquaticus DSM 21051]
MVKRLTQTDVKSLYQNLKNKSNEKDVESAWRDIFKKYFVDHNQDGMGSISSPLNVDGLIIENRIVFALRILLEFKDGTNLQEAYDRARITIQCIYYMKQFEEKGIQLPNVIIGADENQAIVLFAPNFYKYLQDKTIDWSIAPSQAYQKNPAMMGALVEDSNLSVFVYDLNAGRNGIQQRFTTIQNLFDEVNSLANFDPKTGEEFKVNVSESNLAVLFDDFVRITFKSLKESDKVLPVDMVNIFQQLLLGRNPDEYYQLPSDPNKLHLPGDKKISINGSDMNAFFKHFNRNLSIQEQDQLISISDRLIEDIARRRKGDYWTPTIWANKAVEVLDERLNNKWITKTKGLIHDWKKDCVVWDCAAGAKNLTRDYYFEHLYSSTIHQSELDLSKQYNLYPETNQAFQYDFLNDDVEALRIFKNMNIKSLDRDEIINYSKCFKIPEKLFMALIDDQPLVIYINPPFGTANSRAFSSEKAKEKRNMSKTEIRSLMLEKSMGRATQQLYAQFFYRIIETIDTFNLSNVILAAFSPYQFRVGGDYFGKFYKRFLRTLHPITGFLFSAGEFSDVSTDWGVTFSLYSNEDIFHASEDLQICNFEDNSISTIGTKEVRTVSEKNSLSNWIKEVQTEESMGDKLEARSYTALTSAINACEGLQVGAYYSNSFGYMYFIGNDVEHSDTAVSIFSSYFKSGHGININKKNLIRSVISFAIRRCADYKWFNGKDAFYMDDDISEKVLNDAQFIGDCLVMSLSQYRASYQSSLGVNSISANYPEIANGWFYYPNDIMEKLYGQVTVSDGLRAAFSKEYRRAMSAEDTPIAKLLRKMGMELSLQTNVNKSQEIYVDFLNESIFSPEAKQMLMEMNTLFNKTWKYRQLAIKSHPKWSLERYDAGFNQQYRVITQIMDDTEWVDNYKKAYMNLKKTIHDYSKNLKIMSREA